MKVIKRNGSKVDFDPSKIELAILKAMRYGSGVVDKNVQRIFPLRSMRSIRETRISAFTGSKTRYLKSSFKKTRF